MTGNTTSNTSSSAPQSGAAEEIQEAKESGVPVGAAVAETGIAAAAAGTAVAAGLGKSESDGVTGVEKVAPNVTQATSASSTAGIGSEKGRLESTCTEILQELMEHYMHIRPS